MKKMGLIFFWSKIFIVFLYFFFVVAWRKTLCYSMNKQIFPVLWSSFFCFNKQTTWFFLFIEVFGWRKMAKDLVMHNTCNTLESWMNTEFYVAYFVCCLILFENNSMLFCVIQLRKRKALVEQFFQFFFW